MRWLLFISLFFVSFVYANKPIISPVFKAYELERKKAIEKCEKEANSVARELMCIDIVDEKMATDPRNRLSKGWCKREYKPLDIKALKAKLKELEALFKKSRGNEDFEYRQRREPGELTKSILAKDIRCIRTELGNRAYQESIERSKKIPMRRYH